jgi:tetratricopeptide (TPR) repeat protein
MRITLSPWDIYQQAKAAKNAQDWSTVVAGIESLSILPAAVRSDPRLGNAVGWLIHYTGKFYLSLEPSDQTGVLHLLQLARAFCYDPEGQPSSYAMLLRLALKTRKANPYFLAFVAWWGIDKLQPDDFLPYEPPGRPSLPALAEQTLLGIGKHLLAGFVETGPTPDGKPDRMAIEGFFQTLGPHLQAHPEFRFLPYVRAQLLLALNQPEEALADLRPFVRTHRQQAWAWDWLGRAYYRLGQMEAARACFARALTARSPEKVTVLTRERYARLCLEAGEPEEAKAAFARVIAVRLREWGKVPARLQHVQEEAWYAASPAKPISRHALSHWAAQADALLEDKIPEELAVVTAVHRGKQLAWYRLDQEREGNLRLHMLAADVQAGDCLRLRVRPRQGQEEIWHEALSARKVAEVPPKELSQRVRGRLTPVSGKPFGFVAQEYFVAAHLLQQHTDLLQQDVQAIVVRDYNRKRKCWGWRVVRLSAAEAAVGDLSKNSS